MAALRQQQQAFRGAVVDVPDTTLFAQGASDPARRLDIYRHAYRSRLTEALAANYPVLARALGDEAFAQLALQYIDARPSRHASIRWFGDQLGAFCDEHPDALPHPALRDLIKLEWASTPSSTLGRTKYALPNESGGMVEGRISKSMYEPSAPGQITIVSVSSSLATRPPAGPIATAPPPWQPTHTTASTAPRT
ncbi:MAG TPA: DNA-binding domain-containing protein, partial [Rhodocyclaceae bacterium]|nr:DNA-binding domain-containing protein [Rhodocyclaceae bacterium]